MIHTTARKVEHVLELFRTVSAIATIGCLSSKRSRQAACLCELDRQTTHL